MQGTLIDGKYQVIRQLGEGGMGAVYEAQHRATGRKVALKVIGATALAAGADIITRFEREARASGSIDSPYVVQVFDAGVDPATNAPYMAMECLTGEDVQGAVKRLGPLAPDVVLRIVVQACHGLQKAHDAGIVHRDIKSANLFLATTDAAEVVTKVLDFGIAKVRASPLAPAGADHKLTKTGAMLGSPVYMSPEQAMDARDLDGRSDIFSLGVVMYEALSGATPNGHRESLGQLLMAICTEPAQPIQDRAPWVSMEIAELVQKALAITPAERFQSAAELRAAAEALLPDGATTITAEMIAELPAETLARRAPRRAPLRSAAALVATVIPAATTNDRVAYEATHIDAAVAPSRSPDLARPTDPSHESPVPSAPSVAEPGGPTMTGAVTANDTATAPATSRRRLPWAAALVAIAIGGGGTYYVKHTASTAAPAKPLAPAEPASASASAAITPELPLRTETVTVTPEAAAVDVDGKRVLVTGGRFEVRGTVGSVHDVKLLLGDHEKHVDVVLAATGPIPSKVDIAPKASATPPAQVRPAVSARSAPAAASASAAKPTGATIDRNF